MKFDSIGGQCGPACGAEGDGRVEEQYATVAVATVAVAAVAVAMRKEGDNFDIDMD
eukprot:CAMPEP_0182495582 /NCGR_PEP_ID=MMETSP1321-20130603/4359_1 /TAXON_ID=91990 /ORGANISM="Bolidomonas sp., Strain RCC1657" /LENGTH=55 /DNA_ID=CAMNT_0024699003 /DNA_START=690 /DNA_END=857 /DNA_ORIENTATION=-